MDKITETFINSNNTGLSIVGGLAVNGVLTAPQLCLKNGNNSGTMCVDETQINQLINHSATVTFGETPTEENINEMTEQTLDQQVKYLDELKKLRDYQTNQDTIYLDSLNATKKQKEERLKLINLHKTSKQLRSNQITVVKDQEIQKLQDANNTTDATKIINDEIIRKQDVSNYIKKMEDDLNKIEGEKQTIIDEYNKKFKERISRIETQNDTINNFEKKLEENSNMYNQLDSYTIFPNYNATYNIDTNDTHIKSYNVANLGMFDKPDECAAKCYDLPSCNGFVWHDDKTCFSVGDRNKLALMTYRKNKSSPNSQTWLKKSFKYSDISSLFNIYEGDYASNVDSNYDLYGTPTFPCASVDTYIQNSNVIFGKNTDSNEESKKVASFNSLDKALRYIIVGDPYPEHWFEGCSHTPCTNSNICSANTFIIKQIDNWFIVTISQTIIETNIDVAKIVSYNKFMYDINSSNKIFTLFRKNKRNII
jgi:hypothetical protein